MVNNFNNTIKACDRCAPNNSRYKRKRPRQVFPPAGPLEFAATAILDPLSRTTNENQHIVVINDRYFKLTRAVSPPQITAIHVVDVFFDHWVIPYGIPTFLFANNGKQSVIKFLANIYTYLGENHLTNTAYHHQTNAKVEQNNRTIVTRLRHYVAEQQRVWNTFVRPLTCLYDGQVHYPTSTAPFSFVLVDMRHDQPWSRESASSISMSQARQLSKPPA